MQMFNFVQHADCVLVICDRPLIFSYCTKLHAVKLAKFLDYGYKRRPVQKGSTGAITAQLNGSVKSLSML
jgi:hypothetical protein